MRLSQTDRIRGGLLGLLVGDALGVPYEFHPAQQLPGKELLEMVPPPTFLRAHQGVPPGTWSDDGAQALVLLESLARNQRFVLRDFAEGLLRWREEGFLAVDGRVFDIGVQTVHALDRLKSGIPPEVSGGAAEMDNGNGSLMRVLPLALWYRGPDIDVARAALRQSLPTHAHPRAQIACIHLCLWARLIYAVHDAEEAWDLAAVVLPEVCDALSLPADEVALVLDPANGARISGSGYVVDTLWSARASLARGDCYEAVVKEAIALGNDTDTTAAVAGGLAGILYGAESIPARWLETLRGRELVAPMLEELARRTEQTPRLYRRVRRTSDLFPLQVVWQGVGSGHLGASSCPGVQLTSSGPEGLVEHRRSLEIDLKQLANLEVAAIVTLLEPDEVLDVGIDGLVVECARLGIQWLHLPLSAERGMDSYFRNDLATLLPALAKLLLSGKRVVVHGLDWDGRLLQSMAKLLAGLQPEWPENRATRTATEMVRDGHAATQALLLDA